MSKDIPDQFVKTEKEYNICADAYVENKKVGWRSAIEEYTIFNVLNKNWDQ